jgi:hypothetical protein
MADKNEEAARAIQAAVEGNATEFSKEMSYLVGNATLRTLNIKEEFVGKVIGGGATLQAGYSIGTTAWKTVEDLSRSDKLCTGLCLVATTCEGVALVASCCKVLPFRYRVYIGAKTTSLAVMRFRNLCRKANGQLGPC